jgi:uncharacterized protein with PIN domain
MRIVKTDLPESFTRCPACKTQLAYTEEDILFDIKFLPHLNCFEQRESIRCCWCGELMILNYKYIEDISVPSKGE